MKNYFLLLLFFIPTAFAVQCGPVRPIIQKTIVFNAERVALTQSYRREHYGIQQQAIKIVPQMIVLHWTDTKDFAQAFNLVNPAKLFNRPELGNTGLLNVSAHYMVDRDGTIYQLMPDNWMARHVIGLNNSAIGIENVGGFNDQADLTKAQLAADVYLVCMLKHKYPTLKYLIGHYEYKKFRYSALWLEKNRNYLTVKADPGSVFMRAIRAQVADLHLLAIPNNSKS